MEKFQILYYFNSPELSVVESKRLDLPSSASLSEVYKWTAYLKLEERFVSLGFRSMSKAANEEYRSFKEGELKFTKRKAEFFLLGEKYQMETEEPGMIPKAFKEMLTSYLLCLPQQN